jgi:hypothetical protein
VFSRPGRRFESHLGHANPLVRGGFCFKRLYKACGGVPLTLVRGLGLAAAVAYSGVWVAGSVPWLVGSPPLFMGAGGSSFRFCRVGLGWPTPVHGFAVRERHDEASLVRNGLGRPLLVVQGSRGRVSVRPREVWTVSTATSSSRSGRRGRVHCQVQGYEFIPAVSEKKETEPSRTPFTPPPDVRLRCTSAGSWELGAGSWELGAGTGRAEECPRPEPVEGFPLVLCWGGEGRLRL